MSRQLLFVDSSVILSFINFPQSNSASVIRLIIQKRFQGLVSEKVLEEVKRIITEKNGEREAFATMQLIRHNFKIASAKEAEPELEKWRGRIKEKDLEHLACAKLFKAKIIAFDRDFQPFPEYLTPKKFLESIGEKTSETEY